MNIGALGANYFLLKPRQCAAVDGTARPAMEGVPQDVDDHHTTVANHCLNLHHAIIGIVDGTSRSSIAVSLEIRCGVYLRCRDSVL